MSLIQRLFPFFERKFTPASAEVDWEYVNTLVHGPGASQTKTSDQNSAVFACLMTIATSYPEPPLVVKRRIGSTSEIIENHPLTKLLMRPTLNGELTTEELLFWTAWAKHTDGNAYWLKIRSGNEVTGNVVALWPVSPTIIEPKSENGEFISFYRRRIGPSEYKEEPVENIVHFRLGLDDLDHRRGLSPLKALVRQISTDDEADEFIGALLKNYAVPGLIVIPAAGGYMTEEDANRIAFTMSQKFGNKNRGNIAVLSKEASVQPFGFSPKDLDMSILHRIPEERISAVIGVPAIIAGLGAGLDRGTYSNARVLRELFTEQKLIPNWRADAAKIRTSLLPDFSSATDQFVEYDITNVRALQEDEDSKYARLEKAVGKPWMTINEARSETGLDPIDGGDELQTVADDRQDAEVQRQAQADALAEANSTAPAKNGSAPQESSAKNGGSNNMAELKEMLGDFMRKVKPLDWTNYP